MILVAGLTPAWQQIVVLDRLRTGEVNRAREVHWCASGKVLNVGLALTQLGASATTLSLVGSGPVADAMRREMSQSGVAVEWIECLGPQRTCTTLLDAERGATTEIVENFPSASAPELDRFAEAFARQAAAEDCQLVVITGSLPHATPADFVSRLMSLSSARVVLDVRGAELLAALPHRPFVVKPNREELAATVGRALPTDHDVWQAMRELRERGASWVIVTDGPRDVFVIGSTDESNGPLRECRWQITPPQVHVVNPIGCGDCFTAGLVWSLQQGGEMLDAIRCGIAAAAVNAGQLLPARITTHEVAAAMASATRIVPS